jgi:hypothetical protein
MFIPYLILFHEDTAMKYYNISFGKIMQDDNEDPEQVSQILNEVLADVAPSNIAVSYSVNMAPCYVDDSDDVEAFKVHALIKCVNPQSISSELHAQLVTVLKERSLHSTFGCGHLSEISREEFAEILRGELCKHHRQFQV